MIKKKHRNQIKNKHRNQVNLRGKKSLAGRMLKVSASKIWFSPGLSDYVKGLAQRNKMRPKDDPRHWWDEDFYVGCRNGLRILMAVGAVRVKR